MRHSTGTTHKMAFGRMVVNQTKTKLDCSIVDAYRQVHDPTYGKPVCDVCGQSADHAGNGQALCDPCQAEQQVAMELKQKNVELQTGHSN